MFNLINHTIIIAEAGVNHNGDISMAKKLIDGAVAAGADYIKFQSFNADLLVSQEAELAEYQQINTNGNETSQYEMLKKLELSEDDHYELKEYAEKNGIKFLSTAFDEYYVDFLFDLGIDFFKIPSGEITNLPYLKKIASKNLPVVISTGMSTLTEIENAINVFVESGLNKSEIIVLQCNTDYPADISSSNLRVIPEMSKLFSLRTGYSDHTEGIEASIAAVALGAVLIEKHFTLDKSLPGPDHKASLTVSELTALVSAIRNIEKALGDGIKVPTLKELVNKIAARKSLHLSRELLSGTILSRDHLVCLRPGDGICPMDINEVIGRKLKINKEKYSILKREDFYD